jgi:FkbM family methyltransferase
MFNAAAEAVKRRAPAVHQLLKRALRQSKLPIPKILNGKIMLVAPEMVRASPTEAHVLKWIAELLRPGDTFFDVGAHYGWMSLVACQHVGRNGKVVAFEPSPLLVQCLQYNKKINRCCQMEIIAKAVVDCDDQLADFYIVNGGESFLNSLIDHHQELTPNSGSIETKIRVQTVSLNKFCKTTRLRPDLVKIDVEGAELLVLQGYTDLLKEYRPKFIVAVHPTWLPEHQQASDLFELFRLHGYRITASQCVQYQGAEFGDYLFIPDSR